MGSGGIMLKGFVFILVLVFLSFECVNAQNENLYSPDFKNTVDAENFFLGHSLTQTSYTLKKNKSMAGTFALAYGVTDQITVATSPYLLSLYNMPNIIVRTGLLLNPTTKIGAHFGYMKTQNYLENEFRMENSYFNLVLTKKWSRLSSTHFQLNSMYFIDDTRPFSIRVARPTRPLQMSLSVLNELSFFKKYENEFGVGLELGIIGFNENLPYNHLGFSFYRKYKKLIVQAGLSVSATQNVTLSNFSEIGDRFIVSEGDYKKIVTHPEVQMQYFF